MSCSKLRRSGWTRSRGSVTPYTAECDPVTQIKETIESIPHICDGFNKAECLGSLIPAAVAAFGAKKVAKPGGAARGPGTTIATRYPRNPTQLNPGRLSNEKRWGPLWGEGVGDARDFVGRYSADDLRGLGLTADTAQELSDFYRLQTIRRRGGQTAPARADLMQHYADVLRAAE